MKKDQIISRNFAENRQRIGGVTFITRSYDNPAANVTAERLLLKTLESKITENKEKVA